jgi:hypothetical protein
MLINSGSQVNYFAGPNENPVIRAGHGGVYSIRNGQSCNPRGVVHNAAMRTRETLVLILIPNELNQQRF